MKLFGFRINAGEIKDVREIEKKFEVDGFEMDKILGNMRVAQMQIVASYKSLEALGMIEITPQTWQCPVTQEQESG